MPVGVSNVNLSSFLTNLLLAVSVVTLAIMVPLDSVILGNPDESLCLSCLVTIYGVSIACIALWLILSQTIGGDKLYGYSLNTLTVVSLIFFLSAIQAATIPRAWRTPYVILCLCFFLFLVWSFFRKGKQTAQVFLMFALLLSLYESANLVQIAWRDITLSPPERGAAEAAVPKPPGRMLPHIFVLIFDELSLVHVLKDDMLDPDIVPNLFRFSRSATWYREAVTPYANTAYAIPALLTGLKDAGTFHQTFFGHTVSPHLFHMAATTHDVYISGYYLPYCEAFVAYVKACQDMLLGLSDYGAMFRSWWGRAVPGEFRHTWLGEQAGQAMANYRDSSPLLTNALQLGQDFSRPTFNYIHVGLPHAPYMFHSSGKIRQDIRDFQSTKVLPQAELMRVRDMYVEQVTYTDKLFGAFLAQLKQRNVLHQSVIIVTIDHGVSFDQAHPWRHQDWIDVDEIARVPLLVKMPGQHIGRVDDRRIRNMDLYSIIQYVFEHGRQISEGAGRK